MASMHAMPRREFGLRENEVEAPLDASEYSYYAERVEAYIPYIGSTSVVIRKLVADLRSGISYLGQE